MIQKVLDSLVENWRRCGVEDGDVLLVHSSLKRLFNKVKADFGILITPNDVFDSLRTALGKEGTLILPLYNFDFPQSKFFSMAETPSQMGALTEIGRNHPDAVRTGHPIYSFSVIGKRSKEFENIDNKSGYGADSPFAKIKELGGKIGIIGLSDQNSMTSYHFVEEQNLVDYRYFKNFEGRYVDAKGAESNKEYSLYVRDLEKGVKTDVDRMMEYLWEVGAFKGERHDEGYGMRTIAFNTLYDETEKKIQTGQAINFLYSID